MALCGSKVRLTLLTAAAALVAMACAIGAKPACGCRTPPPFTPSPSPVVAATATASATTNDRPAPVAPCGSPSERSAPQTNGGETAPRNFTVMCRPPNPSPPPSPRT